MNQDIVSIRAFIGSIDFDISRSFYRDLGFEEHIISPDMSYFVKQGFGFYLQDYYVKDWVNNTMLFLEVDNADECWNELVALHLTQKYKGVRLTPLHHEEWGKECFLHDPSGVLWHFGQFFK